MLLFLTGVRNRDALALAPRFETRERLELLTLGKLPLTEDMLR